MDATKKNNRILPLIIYKILTDFFREGCSAQAAFLAYVSLLSLVPLMVLGFYILTIFPFFAGLQEKIQQFIFNNFIASSAQILLTHIREFIAQSKQLSIFGIISLLITSAIMILSLERTLNQIWQTAKHRNFLEASIVYLAVLICAPILLGLGFATSSYLIGLKLSYGAFAITTIKKILLAIFPYILTFLAFILIYIIVPNCKVKIYPAAIGALVATIFFEISKYGFAVYIANFPFYHLLYGAFSIIPIFLIWLYVSWFIVLFGAVVCQNMTTVKNQ